MRRPTRTWSPVLEVDGMPIAYDATLRHYHRGHAGLVAEALEQLLLLLKDMKAYRTFNHPELFLSLKRDLAMVSDYSLFFINTSISLHFIAKVTCSFFFLGHTASFCGRGVGKERPWRDQACPGCSSRSRGVARRPKRKTS